MSLHQLATLLRDRPSAVELLCQPAADLTQRLAYISKRYSPYWDDRGTGDDERPRRLKTPDEILAGALARNWHLLLTDWSYLQQVEAVLQNEIGQEPGDGTRLVAYCILHRVSPAAGGGPGLPLLPACEPGLPAAHSRCPVLLSRG